MMMIVLRAAKLLRVAVSPTLTAVCTMTHAHGTTSPLHLRV